MALSKYVDVMKQWSEPAMSWAADHPRLALGLAVSGLGTLYLLQGRLRAPRLPPGPLALPIVGSLLSLSSDFEADIVRLKKKYGDVFTIWTGSQPLVILASYDTIKEVFLTRGADFAGRPPNLIFADDVFQDEIFNPPFNDTWSKNKKYAVSSLRTLGGVKAAADGAIVEEMAVLMNILRDKGQEGVDIKEDCLLTTTSIMAVMMFNERLDHDDPKLVEFKNLFLEFYEVLNEFSMMDILLPVWMAKLLSRGKLRRYRESMVVLEAYMANHVEEHRKSLDPANPRDFIDMYLIKQDMEIGKSFYDTMIAFLPDAIDSIATFMRWVVLFMAHHPDVQKKAQAELDQVVGPSQMVNISHRSQLKYTDAVILEVMRCSDASNSTTAHCATKSGLTYRGYDLPPSASVMGSIKIVHHDPKLFPNPEKFYPERFIGEKGELVNANYVMPFSIVGLCVWGRVW